ncbi:MAG: MarR family transcriptional regulator [Acidimicrobiia bacterium]
MGQPGNTPDPSPRETDPVEVVDAVLRASRVLVAVAARSLVGVDRAVTLPQFRALVVLASRGPLNPGTLANALGVHSSTATRMCDRLVAKELVTRDVPTTNRREVQLALTPRGRRIVDSVTQRRREEIARIVERVPHAQRRSMVRALRAFGDAAGELPDDGWALGWVEE